MVNKRLPMVRRLVSLVRPAVTGLIVAHVTLGSSVRATTKTVQYAILARMENIRTQKDKHPVYPASPGNLPPKQDSQIATLAPPEHFQTTHPQSHAPSHPLATSLAHPKQVKFKLLRAGHLPPVPAPAPHRYAVARQNAQREPTPAITCA